MKLASLFSGGKDSCYSLLKAKQQGHEIVCLISIISENKESYMFHFPNIHLVKEQAEALELPIILKQTKGKKELELDDLKEAIKQAIKKFNIEGIVCGALASEYQRSRVQKICDELNIKMIAPLWHTDIEQYMHDLIKDNFKIIISGIGAEGLSEQDLGKVIDKDFIEKTKKTQIHLGAEGGEYETTVLDCPLFRKRIEILDAEKQMDSEYSGVYKIKKVKLVEKTNH